MIYGEGTHSTTAHRARLRPELSKLLSSFQIEKGLEI